LYLYIQTIISVKLILYTNAKNKKKDSLPCRDVGAWDSGLPVEAVGPPARRLMLWWVLGTTILRRGCRTSYSMAGPPVGARDGGLTLRLQDLWCGEQRPSPARRVAGLLRGGGRRTSSRRRTTTSLGRGGDKKARKSAQAAATGSLWI
jgi:hypothetical protein